jgi:hypothetical protein
MEVGQNSKTLIAPVSTIFQRLLRPKSKELLLRTTTLVCIYLLAFSIRLVGSLSLRV